MQGPDIDTHITEQLISIKISKQFSGERKNFSTNGCWNHSIYSHMQKCKPQALTHHLQKLT